MTGAALAIGAIFAVGLPLARAVDREARGTMLLGLAYLYGSGAVFAVLGTFALAGIRWATWTIAAALAVIAIGASRAAWRIAPRVARAPDASGAAHVPERPALARILDALTLLSGIAYALYATLAAPWEWDFWAIWGLKGRVFHEAGGVDWRYLASPWNEFAHPDYPLLLPLNYAFVGLIDGDWNDRWLGLWSVGYAGAALAVVRHLARREASPWIASAITLAITGFALSRHVGSAEAPLIAFGGCGLLFARVAAHGDATAARHAALCLGLGASVKNEGLALAVAVAIALAVVQRRLLVRLWPALAIAAPWLVLRAVHALPTDLAEGNVLARLGGHLGEAGSFAFAFAREMPRPWFWLTLALALAVTPRAAIAPERVVLLASGLQTCFVLGAFLMTPHDMHWHIATAWPRLADQLGLPLTFSVLLALARVLTPKAATWGTAVPGTAASAQPAIG